MGDVIYWPHGRTSTKLNALRSGTKPRASSSLFTSKKRRAGMAPRKPHETIVPRETPNNEAAAISPPKASMMELTLSSTSLCTLRNAKVSSPNGTLIANWRYWAYKFRMWTPEMVGNRLVRLRKALGHNQRTMAEICGISGPMLSLYESGDRELTLEAAKKIMIVTRVDLNWLYEGKDDNIPHWLATALRKADTAEAADAPRPHTQSSRRHNR